MAKYLRSNVPRKKAIIKGENAEYFVGEHLIVELSVPSILQSLNFQHSYIYLNNIC